MRTLVLLIVSIVLGTGCTRTYLADTVDLEWDWAPFTGTRHELHMPYVAGSDFDLYTVHEGREDPADWTIESEDASVIRVDSTANGSAHVSATGAGTANVSLRDADGHVVFETPFDVRQANRAELFAHGPLIIDRPEMQESWDEIRIVVGGSATFEVEWFDANERLFGNGALSTAAPPGVTAEARRTFLFEDREWVTFTPTEVGTFDVELRANGVAVRTVRIIALTEDAVATVLLHGMDESAAEEGDVLTVLAQAYDAQGRTIFGIDYAWDLDGETQTGFGDLFRYSLVPGETAMLEAQSSSMSAQVMIQAMEGWVDSTNHLGCSIAPWSGRAALAPWVVAFGLFVFIRRRSARRVHSGV
jgi:hypothetical protein